MLSITDLKDFVDLDRETVQIVQDAARLPELQATLFAIELLKTRQGIGTLHEMFREQIAVASRHRQQSSEHRLRKSYAYFSRKYPLPKLS